MTESVSTEAVVATAATKAVYGSSAATIVLGLTVGEWAALIGLGATLATFAANLWFGMKRDAREQELHQKRMKAPARKTRTSLLK